MSSRSPDLLEAIVAATVREVGVREDRTGATELERIAGERTPDGRAFRASLETEGRFNVIAECKRRSPSRGVLRADYRPAVISRAYEAAGAAAVSVLTEPAFFDGSLDDLAQVRHAVQIPILRKDFVVSRYQILEARAAGADAILLIVAALDDRMLRRLLEDARAEGLAVLVEVHDLRELSRALDAGARIVGVNNRNLRTLSVDLEASRSLISKIPADIVSVAESGLQSHADLLSLREAGYNAFLVGESLMSREDPGEALGELLADDTTAVT